jgi:hypothetical protein
MTKLNSFFGLLFTIFLIVCFQNGEKLMAQIKNSFDLGNAAIPVEEILWDGKVLKLLVF